MFYCFQFQNVTLLEKKSYCKYGLAHIPHYRPFPFIRVLCSPVLGGNLSCHPDAILTKWSYSITKLM